jgi:hypothetical protein
VAAARKIVKSPMLAPGGQSTSGMHCAQTAGWRVQLHDADIHNAIFHMSMSSRGCTSHRTAPSCLRKASGYQAPAAAHSGVASPVCLHLLPTLLQLQFPAHPEPDKAGFATFTMLAAAPSRLQTPPLCLAHDHSQCTVIPSQITPAWQQVCMLLLQLPSCCCFPTRIQNLLEQYSSTAHC